MDIFEAISDTQQRSEEWHNQRMGKFTASRFGDLMTNGRKKDEVLGQTAISYIYEKAAELLTGQRTEIFGKALDWGNEYEPICKAYYSELRGVTIEEMPFVEINDYSGGFARWYGRWRTDRNQMPVQHSKPSQDRFRGLH